MAQESITCLPPATKSIRSSAVLANKQLPTFRSKRSNVFVRIVTIFTLDDFTELLKLILWILLLLFFLGVVGAPTVADDFDSDD